MCHPQNPSYFSMLISLLICPLEFYFSQQTTFQFQGQVKPTRHRNNQSWETGKHSKTFSGQKLRQLVQMNTLIRNICKRDIESKLQIRVAWQGMERNLERENTVEVWKLNVKSLGQKKIRRHDVSQNSTNSRNHNPKK